MKKLFLIPVLLLSLAVVGCSGAAKVADLVSTVTTPITNPVGKVDIYRAKNVYAATVSLAVDYRTYCWSKPYSALLADPVANPICKSRRAVVRKIQAADTKAFFAIRKAERFVQKNPTVTAASVISAAWTAVRQFQNAVPRIR